jgi:hypothetical protein
MSFDHHQVGSIHVVIPHGDIAAVREATSHELETCRAPAIVVDLTDTAVGADELGDLLISLDRPEFDRHWQFRVSETDLESFESEGRRLGVAAVRFTTEAV